MDWYPKMDVDNLPLPIRVKRLIKEGKPKGERSEAMWWVMHACIEAGLSDEEIISIFYHYPIGEKFRERNSVEWLLSQIRKAERNLTSPQPIRTQLKPNPPVKGDKDFVNRILFTRLNGITQYELTVPATEKLFDMLRSYGNNLSYEQRAALWELMKTYTAMAQGLRGRLAYPLPTGAGKTLSIIAWISTLVEIGADHISVAVCTSKVESLCNIKRELIKCGVPVERIGLLHSYKYNQEVAETYISGRGDLPGGYASEPSDEDTEEKQILLITHSRVKSKGQLEKYAYYKGKPRDLLIWDESLFTSNAEGISIVDIESAIGWLEPRTRMNPRLNGLVKYLKKYLEIAKKETLRLYERGGEPQVLNPPELSHDEITTYKDVLDELEDPAMTDRIKDLIDKSQNQFRIVNTPQGSGVIYYEIVVPLELDKIVILDASYRIRNLEQLDPTIECLAYYDKDIVSYENVTVHHLKAASGRTSITGDFRDEEQRSICKEVIEVIKEIPEDEGIIIFTFKTRTVNFEQILKQELRASRVRVDQTIEVNGTRKQRIVFLTWGNETYLSEYSYCSNIIFAGVLHRSYIDLAAQIAGQSNSLTRKIDNELLLRVLDSEIAHCLYQAMSRGSCRILNGRVTRPMQVWLIHPNDRIRPILEQVMPGIRWIPWRPKHYRHMHNQQRIAFAISDFLETYDGDKISTRTIRRKLGLESISRRTWNNGLNRFLETSEEWKLEKQSLVRVKKPDFFDCLPENFGRRGAKYKSQHLL